MKNLYIEQLNDEMYEIVRNACINALEELGEIEMLEDALSGRLCDLDALINIDEILK
mgnify:CR=1 FL=1